MLGISGLGLFTDPLGTLARDAIRYGDVVAYRILFTPVVLLAHPDAIRHVLQENHRNYSKNNMDYRLLKRFLGEGLLTSEGSLWLRQRRLIQPVFHRQRIAAFGDMMLEATSETLDRWRTHAERQEPLDVLREMMRLTLKIVARALFSVDLSDQSDTIYRALTTLNEYFGNAGLVGFFLPWLPTRRNREAVRAAETLDAVVRGIIEKRRNAAEAPGDLLSLMLSARDETTGSPMNARQLRDEVLTLLLAGHETTANALTWTFYLLARHPEVETKVRAEVAEVTGGGELAPSALPHLVYTRMVIEEAMRLYPPAWAISRAAEDDDEIGGYRIRRGSTVILSQWVTHRHPRLWPDPERFNPERFRPEISEERPKFAYFPFGGGPRLCIGANFAMTEATLILATAIKQFSLKLIPDHPVELEPLVTLRPRYGMRMVPLRATAPSSS